MSPIFNNFRAESSKLTLWWLHCHHCRAW